MKNDVALSATTFDDDLHAALKMIPVKYSRCCVGPLVFLNRLQS